MSVRDRKQVYERALRDWKIMECLGEGAFGAVYKVVRNQMLLKEECALKVINLIEEHGRLESLPPSKKNDYIRMRDNSSKKALEEVQMMYAWRGHTNIVDYLDCKFEDWSDGTSFGRDLLIRMELLDDLEKIMQNGKIFSEKEIIQIGIDVCSALARCRKTSNFIHRDIKPANIFVNKNGDYKLGDFGISKIIANIPGSVARTQTGTPSYLAPEQLSAGYDNRIDIYSLGLVLYQLGNQNRLPFQTSSYITEAVIMQRLRGDALPKPSNVSSQLATVILKACAYQPLNRYQTPEAFKEALLSIGKSPVVTKPSPLPSKPYVAPKPSTPIPSDEFNNLLRLANQGDVNAQYSLGHKYEFGKGVNENLHEAARWYRKAAEKNNTKAQFILYNMGLLYNYSIVDKNEAIKWLRKVAEKGNKFDQHLMGLECLHAKNYTEAMQWFQKAAQQNCATAYTSIGDCYFNGYGVTRNYSEAVSWYVKGAKNNDSNAIKKLGDCYMYGYGLPKNTAQAEYWYGEYKKEEEKKKQKI